MKGQFSNWQQVLEHQAHTNSNHIALSVYHGSDSQALTYSQLAQRAKALANTLSQHNKFGDRVMLLMPNGIDYVVAFFACIYAGVVAVPIYPARRKARDWRRLNSIVQDCQPNTLVCLSQDSNATEDWCKAHNLKINTVFADKLNINDATLWQTANIDTHDIAYLQYSSGSTGQPKGVMLSHYNLLSNTGLIIDTYDMCQSDIMINWLPLYHDMGCVGGILSPIRAGATIHILASAKVAQNPYVLLQAITALKATVTAAPNFIFDLAVEKVTATQRSTLDLSSLRILINGAEPVNAHTLDNFYDYFHYNGLAKNAVKPSYGMAEACLLVTATPINKPYKLLSVDSQAFSIDKVKVDPASAKHIASSGQLIEQIPLRIVDVNTRMPLPDGQIGEIMYKGDSVTRGYWQKPELNEQTFNLNIEGDPGFMATGDLGFVEQQQLYVTGRKKEMLILHGCNYYPQDIEHSLTSLSKQLTPHGAAIFEVAHDNNTKELVLVQELTRESMRYDDYVPLFKQIRAIIAQEHELRVTAIVLIKPATLSKTSSGKIQRLACKQAYINNELEAVAKWQQAPISNAAIAPIKAFDPPHIASWIMQWISNRLGQAVNTLSSSQQLMQIGLDSIDAMSLVHELSRQLDLSIRVEIVLNHPSIEQLSIYLAQQYAQKSQAPANEMPTEGML
ncbi:2-succinylbenzoate--CoA ligase [Pseudoalteromonas sp. CIP111854]|uniref:2-succinylbenzoate--CoA ligase n=1 Tax=Pseudoalteromonas holothuriae TaxID=2963714 RepID=A0A9W4R0N0_9GAMM|nr:AMP-binding protein [Pseudoalteromonas sp. CIP111854]CAH9061876.1 2-succinylbenzoate--CoA ligase [Pseudoalteromonas sp. CIP111854]